MIEGAWWTEDREGEQYRFTLLTQSEATIRALDGVKTGSIEWNVDAEIRSSGNLTVANQKRIASTDWHSYRIRVEYGFIVDGEEHWYPLGIYLPSAPVTSVEETGTTQDLEIYDKLLVLRQDCLDKTWTFKKGTKMTAALANIISSTGETNFSITDSPKVFSSNRVYPAGTPKLTMVNKILSDLGYFSAWCDGNGQYRCHPYVLPKDRPPVYAFTEGEASIHEGEWELDQDGFEVPNKVVAISRANGKAKAKVAVAIDEATSTLWSHQARGRWIVRVEQDLDIKTQTELQKKANELLASSQDIHDVIQIKHAWLPVSMNEVVSFNSQGYAGHFAFRKSTITLTPGVLVSSYLEGVSR